MMGTSTKKEGRVPTDQNKKQNDDSAKITKVFDVYGQLQVSFFSTCQDNKPESTRTVGDVLKSFVQGNFKKQIEYLRKLPEDKYKVEKATLPGVTFAATFSTRNKDLVETLTGLMSVDFDKIPNPEQFRDELKTHPFIYSAWVSPSNKGVKALLPIPYVDNDAEYKVIFKQVQKVLPGIDGGCNDLTRLCFACYDPGLWTNPTATIFELQPEQFEEVRTPQPVNIDGDLTPWKDFDEHGELEPIVEPIGWTRSKVSGPNEHWCRPGKTNSTSATWHREKRLFYNFSSNVQGLEPGKAYSLSALYALLNCGGDFKESGKQLREKGFGSSQQPSARQEPRSSDARQTPPERKHFKDYIIKEEPTEEKGIISISGVNVLSIGNVLLLTGPMKGRKTMLASILVNQCKLKTAYIDSEQGKKHSWRTGRYTPTADVFHMRGEDPKEIMRVINCCVESGEYQLMVLDNVRDLLSDFNNVEQSGELELFLKKVSESVPVIAILHENKNSTKGQGHLGHGAAKIAQTTIRVQLVDVEDPAKGSFVECVHSRDEPFKRAFISKDGVLSNDDLIKTGGKTILFDDFIQMIGNDEFSQNALLEKIAEIFDIKESSARNSFREIRKAWPNAFSERKEGKKKFYRYCIDFKMHNNAAMH